MNIYMAVSSKEECRGSTLVFVFPALSYRKALRQQSMQLCQLCRLRAGILVHGLTVRVCAQLFMLVFFKCSCSTAQLTVRKSSAH